MFEKLRKKAHTISKYNTMHTNIHTKGICYIMKKSQWFHKLTVRSVLSIIILLGFSTIHASAKPGDPYSSDKAAAYADSCFKKVGNSYQKNPNPTYGEELCAGYVSQCLKEGGMSMDETWNWKGINKTTEAWRLSKNLFSYLKDSGYKVNYSPTEADVQKGDVVFYWTNGGWGHVAICVGKTSKGVPMVNAYNDPHYHFSYWTMGYKTCVVSIDNGIAAPKISQTVVSGGKKITLTPPSAGATMFYTTDGSTPTINSTMYNGPFTLKGNSIITTFAILPDGKVSTTASELVDIYKTLAEGTYYINTSANSKMTLGVNGFSKKESIPLTLMPANAQYDRKVSVKYNGNGNYTFTLLHSGYALSESDINSVKLASEKNIQSGASSINASGSVVQKKLTSSVMQQWRLNYIQKQQYTITNLATSNYLSIGRNVATGSYAYTSSAPEALGQVWNIKPTTKSKLKVSKYKAAATTWRRNKYKIQGTIQSNFKIQSVTAQFKNAKKKLIAKVTVKPQTTSYSLAKLSSKLSLRKVKSGRYTFTISAKDATKVNKTLITRKVRIK